MRLVLVICVLLAGCSLRQLERMERWRAGADLELDTRGVRREAPAAGGEPSDTVDAGLGLRAHGGPGKLGLLERLRRGGAWAGGIRCALRG